MRLLGVLALASALAVLIFSEERWAAAQRFEMHRISDQSWVVLDRKTGETRVCVLRGCAKQGRRFSFHDWTNSENRREARWKNAKKKSGKSDPDK